jgi:hypothetical protein
VTGAVTDAPDWDQRVALTASRDGLRAIFRILASAEESGGASSDGGWRARRGCRARAGHPRGSSPRRARARLRDLAETGVTSTVVVWESEADVRRCREGELVKEAIAFEQQTGGTATRAGPFPVQRHT